MDKKELNESKNKIIRNLVSKYVENIPNYEYEDLLLEAAIAAQEAMNDFDISKDVKITTHIYNRVKYKLVNLRRQEFAKKRGFNLIVKENKMALNESISNLVEIIPSTDKNIEEQLLDIEKKEFILKTAEKILKPEEYKCLMLVLEGYNYSEIANKMGVNLKKVSNRIYSGRKKLKKRRSKFEKYLKIY